MEYLILLIACGIGATMDTYRAFRRAVMERCEGKGCQEILRWS